MKTENRDNWSHTRRRMATTLNIIAIMATMVWLITDTPRLEAVIVLLTALAILIGDTKDE